MTQKKYFPTVISGFGVAAVVTAPVFGGIFCLFVLPVGAIASLYVYQRLNNFPAPVNGKNAFMFGMLTGVFAAVFRTLFDVLLTFIFKTNNFVELLPELEDFYSQYYFKEAAEQTLSIINSMAVTIQDTGFSLLYTIVMLFGNLIMMTIIGIAAGFLGMVIINKKFFSHSGQ